MQEIYSGKLYGEFNGYHSGAIFHLSNGQLWQQKKYKYKYKYKYRPSVRIVRDGNKYYAEFDCMSEPIEVVRASIVEDGTIMSDFNGFDGQSRFHFDNGHVWEQAEYKYIYHYAYNPHALVVDGIEGTVLHVDGMSDHVQVRRVG